MWEDQESKVVLLITSTKGSFSNSLDILARSTSSDSSNSSSDSFSSSCNLSSNSSSDSSSSSCNFSISFVSSPSAFCCCCCFLSHLSRGYVSGSLGEGRLDGFLWRKKKEKEEKSATELQSDDVVLLVSKGRCLIYVISETRSPLFWIREVHWILTLSPLQLLSSLDVTRLKFVTAASVKAPEYFLICPTLKKIINSEVIIICIHIDRENDKQIYLSMIQLFEIQIRFVRNSQSIQITSGISLALTREIKGK